MKHVTSPDKIYELDDIASDPKAQTEVFEQCPVTQSRERYALSSGKERDCKTCNEHGLYFHQGTAYVCGLYNDLRKEKKSA